MKDIEIIVLGVPESYIPISDAATPVGASNKHFGFDGSSPANLRIFSTHRLKTLIKKDLPQPPPPVK